MLKRTVPVGFLPTMQSTMPTAFSPKKPVLDLGKIKAKLKEFYDKNEEERIKSDENKAKYPRMHQSVQATALQLVIYYMKNWGKPNASNCEVRITYGYLRQALNKSCCIATLKNHVNKMLAMFGGFVKEKYRGGLGLEHQNTACIVLVFDEEVFQFREERHNEAIRQDKKFAAEYHRNKAESARMEYDISNTLSAAKAGLDAHIAKRTGVPSSIASIFQAAYQASPKRE